MTNKKPVVINWAMERLLDEHTAGEHKVPHPDCGACKIAAQAKSQQTAWPLAPLFFHDPEEEDAHE
jgi:hypothetical protein